MKLFYAPGTCALSPHIALREGDLEFSLIEVDLKSKRLRDGSDFTLINPKGSVPVLEFGTERLTEGPAILQYIADLVPDKNLAPPNGSVARYRLQEWLNFISSELHKGFSPLFAGNTPEEFKPILRERLRQRFQYVNTALADRDFLMGSHFSVADGYLFVMTRWTKRMGVSIEDCRHVGSFAARIAERASVRAAIAAEER